MSALQPGDKWDIGEEIPEEIPALWVSLEGEVAINIEGVAGDEVAAYAERRLRQEMDEMSRRLMLPRMH